MSEERNTTNTEHDGKRAWLGHLLSLFTRWFVYVPMVVLFVILAGLSYLYWEGRREQKALKLFGEPDLFFGGEIYSEESLLPSGLAQYLEKKLPWLDERTAILHKRVVDLDASNCKDVSTVLTERIHDFKYLRILRLGCVDISDLSSLEGLSLRELNIDGTRVGDLSPLEGMPLTSLSIAFTNVTDLSPLRGMSLEQLNISFTEVKDLSSIAGMPLREFDCKKSKVTDLSPLAGMPLEVLDITSTKVKDLTPLKKACLKRCILTGTPVSDISALKGMPIQSLDMDLTKVRDISALQGMPLKYLHIGGASVDDLSPLEGITLQQDSLHLSGMAIRDLSPLGGCLFREIDVSNTPLESLAGIERMSQLTDLIAANAQIKDISAVKNSSVTCLVLSGCPIDSLEQLKGAHLETLDISGTKISDLSMLNGMPLGVLSCIDTPVDDWRPLISLKQLSKLGISMKSLRNEKTRRIIKGLEQLEYISTSSDYFERPAQGQNDSTEGPMLVKDFWAKYGKELEKGED